jgi:hypothetical protein
MTKKRLTINHLLSAVGVFSIATASAQTPASKALRNEPLEKYDMPPAYIYRLETGPRMISQFGVFTKLSGQRRSKRAEHPWRRRE